MLIYRWSNQTRSFGGSSQLLYDRKIHRESEKEQEKKPSTTKETPTTTKTKLLGTMNTTQKMIEPKELAKCTHQRIPFGCVAIARLAATFVFASFYYEYMYSFTFSIVHWRAFIVSLLILLLTVSFITSYACKRSGKKAEMITDRTIWSWLMSTTPSQTTTMHSLIRLYAIECISWLLDSCVHFEFHYYYCCYLHRSYLFHFCPVHTVCCCHSSSLAPHPFGCGQIHRRTMHRTELQWIYRYGSHLVPFFFVQSAGFGCFVLSFCEARRERVSVCLLVVFNWTINARAWCALCIHRLMACPITKSSSILLDLLYHLYLVSILPQA